MTEGLKSRTVRVAGVNDVLISPDIGVMSHIPSAVTCGFSIWTVAGSLVAASHLWDESGSLGVVAEPLRWRLTSV